jgi:hypothetical protein
MPLLAIDSLADPEAAVRLEGRHLPKTQKSGIFT